MTRKRLAATLSALSILAGLTLAAAPASAQWRHPGYGHGYYRGPGPGAIVGGALLGLGVGALLAAPHAPPPPPPVVYAPPARPYYYPPPAYAYAPPPPYYPPPGYYVR